MRMKVTGGMTLLLLVVLFTLQNTEVIRVRFIFWDLELSRALMFFLVLAIGILIGFLAGGGRHRLDNAKDDSFQGGESEKNRNS